ncbi:hypothetical protein [Coleofasciculus sp. G2-EDA-02]|uniref:hypothetical protein n=1 Tax=Coleofasciculus sp. G2-EDA-02 TaxID=3069529 RepID=UPI0032F67EB6
MATRLPSWMLERRLEQTRAREQYLTNKNKQDETFNSNVEPRPTVQVGYRSLLQLVGATPAPAMVAIKTSESACKWYEGLGTTGTLGASHTKLGLTYGDLSDFLEVTKFDVSKIISKLGGTPTPIKTAWGTRYIRYTKSGEGNARASYTAPISVKTGAVTVAAIESAARAIATAVASDIGSNGSIYLEFEEATNRIV